MALEWIHPDELRNHATNISIYGDTPDQELVESVRLHGVFEDHPIGYVMDGEFRVIVSGHRRNQAAKLTKQEMVPCVRLKDIEDDPLAIEERIILSNKQRVKTNEQKAREAAKLADILKSRAQARSAANLKNSAESSTVSGDTVEKTRQKVADSLDVSEATAQRLITAGKALTDAESKGQTRKATAIKKGLQKSAAAGAKAAKPKPAKKPAEATQEEDGPDREPRHKTVASQSVIKKAERLLLKVVGCIQQISDDLAPLVRAFDEIKSADPAFTPRHRELLGHHSRLFQLSEDNKRAGKALKAAWDKK